MVTAANVAEWLEAIDSAYGRMNAAEFAEWISVKLGFPAFETKGVNRKRATDFVKRLAVTDTQTQF